MFHKIADRSWMSCWLALGLMTMPVAPRFSSAADGAPVDEVAQGSPAHGASPEKMEAGRALTIQSMRLVAAGDVAGAERLLRAFLEEHPLNPAAPGIRLLHGQCLAALGRHEEARQAFERAASSAPRGNVAPAALEHLARLHEQQEEPEAAARTRERLLREHPASRETVRLWLESARSAFESHRYAEAAAIYVLFMDHLEPGHLLELQAAWALEDGGDAEPVIASARAAMREGRHLAAAELLQGLRNQSPEHRASLELIAMQARCLIGMGGQRNFEEARDVLERVFRHPAIDGELARDVAWELVRLNAGSIGDPDAAHKWWERAMEVTVPGTFEHQQGLFIRARILQGEGRHSAALTAFEDFAGAYPNEAATPAFQGFIKESREKLAEREP